MHGRGSKVRSLAVAFNTTLMDTFTEFLFRDSVLEVAVGLM